MDQQAATLEAFTACSGMKDRSAAEYAVNGTKLLVANWRIRDAQQSHSDGEAAVRLVNENLGLLHDFAPTTASEGLLARQILATDQLVLGLSRQLLAANGSLDTRLVQHYERLSRLLLRQLDALRRLQRPDQRIEVKQVIVNGGQAVVGAVATRGARD